MKSGEDASSDAGTGSATGRLWGPADVALHEDSRQLLRDRTAGAPPLQ